MMKKRLEYFGDYDHNDYWRRFKCDNDNFEWISEDENIYILRTYEGYRVRCGTCRYMGIAEKTIPGALIAWNRQPRDESKEQADKEPECAN